MQGLTCPLRPLPPVRWPCAYLADRIGVVVTDHVMPDCTGSEFVRSIRTENDWLPIIVLSGMPEAMAEYDGLDVIFRVKPFPPVEMD